MKSRIIQVFLLSAGAILLVTAGAKFVSASGSAHILQNRDPILGIQFASVLWIVGGIELVVACCCFFSKRLVLQNSLIAWLATNFLVYRMGLEWIGYQKPCSCLGNLTDALHIPPALADTGMKVVLGYLLLGSYASLFCMWRAKEKSSGSTNGVKSLEVTV